VLEKYDIRFEIVVNRNLPLLDRYATLAYELGHLLCGHLGARPEELWPDRRLLPARSLTWAAGGFPPRRCGESESDGRGG
jgi:hypothetical protein